MRLLICDAGNSRVRLVLWEGDPAAADPLHEPEPARRQEWDAPAGPAASAALAGEIAEEVLAAGDVPLVLASVVPVVTAALQAEVPGLIVIDHRLPLPFGLGVVVPAAVGADRYCNVAAACRAGWRDALIVDVGTATTFDLLLAGVFVGGLIAPGPAFAAQKLGERAARLDPVPFGPCELAAGADTAAAMQAGAYHVGVLGIQGVVEGLLARYGRRPVVVTGGLGGHLARPGWHHDPAWTLRGAAYLAAVALGG